MVEDPSQTNVEESEPISLKRKSDEVSTSFESHEEKPAGKITHVAASTPTKDSVTLTSEQAMVKAMESSMSRVYAKLDTILNRINDIEISMSELKRQGERRDEQLEELLTRVRLSEAKNSDLEERLRILETRETDQGWSPSPNNSIKVKLLGDSNYSGKIKFGEVRGTLGGGGSTW